MIDESVNNEDSLMKKYSPLERIGLTVGGLTSAGVSVATLGMNFGLAHGILEAYKQEEYLPAGFGVVVGAMALALSVTAAKGAFRMLNYAVKGEKYD